MQMGSWLCRSFRKGQRQTLLLFRHCHFMMDLCRNGRWVKKKKWAATLLSYSDPRTYFQISVNKVELLFHQNRPWKTGHRGKVQKPLSALFVLMNYSNSPLVYWQYNIVAGLNEDGNSPHISLPNVMHWLLPIVADILLSVLSTVKQACEDISILCKCSVRLLFSWLRTHPGIMTHGDPSRSFPGGSDSASCRFFARRCHAIITSWSARKEGLQTCIA